MMLQQSVPGRLNYEASGGEKDVDRRTSSEEPGSAGSDGRRPHRLAHLPVLFTPRPECHIPRGDKQLQRRPSQCRHLETSHLDAQAGLPSSSSAGLLHSPSLWPAPTEGGCITLHCKPEAGLPAGADHPYRPHPLIPLPGRCTKKGHV